MEIDFNKSVDVQKFKAKIMAYGLNEEQAELIATKEQEKNFDILIAELNEKVRTRKLNIKNAVGYLVGIYQKKGIIPNKD